MNKTLFGKVLTMSLAIILVVSLGTTVIMNFFIQEYVLSNKKQEMIRLGQRVSDTIVRQIKRTETMPGSKNSMLGVVRIKTLIDEMEEVVGVQIWFTDKDGLIYTSEGVRQLPDVERRLLLGGGRIVKHWNDEKGQPVLAVSIPINYDGQALGGLFIITPMKEIILIQTQIRRILLASTLIGALGAVGIAYFFSRHLAKPIIAMQGLIGQMRNGDFSGQLDVKREDELGELVQHFNDLNRELNFTTAQLRTEEEKNRRIINSMAEGVVSLNPNGEVLVINPAARKILKAGNAEGVELKSIIGIFPGLMEHFKQVLKEKDLVFWEVESNNQIIHAVASPIKTGETILGVVIILQDITNRWRLIQMQKELVANVSHEFKTPLTSIKGFVELMLDKKIQDEKAVESSLRIIHNEASRLTKMVNTLLRTARLEVLRLRKEPVDISWLVQKVVNSLAFKFDETQVKVHIGPALQRVLQLDLDRMEQVFYNLIDNAIRFSPNGGVIEITAVSGEKNFEIWIRDHGPGIPVAEQELIFDRFYKVEKARSSNDSGSGLGLAIVKNIVEEHGGQITVMNHPEGGAIFILQLPG